MDFLPLAWGSLSHMSANLSQVILGVSDHWLVGHLPLEDERIQDRLNDNRSDFVSLSKAEVHLSGERPCISQLPEIVVAKSKIEFVAVPSRQHEAPDERLVKYASKDVFNTQALLSRYYIAGECHLPSFSGDAVHTLAHQLARFFPITEAALSGRGIKQIRFPLLIANKDFVGCFHVDGDAQKKDEAVALEQLHALLAETENG